MSGCWILFPLSESLHNHFELCYHSRKGATVKKLLLLVFALILVFSAASCRKKDSAVSPEKVFSWRDFTFPNTCSGCHADIYEQWNGSMHSNAYDDKFFRALYLEASKDTNGKTDKFCMSCHSPIAVLTGEVPPADGSNVSEISKRAIQCDFCHTVSDIEKIGNASYILSPGNVKRGPFDNSNSPYHETAFSELHTKSEFCGMCHNLTEKTHGVPLEATYTEWKEGP